MIAKLRQGGAGEIWQTECGTTFGYQNLVVDMRSFALMKANGCPAIFDASHSVQLPGAAGGKSVAEQAAALGCDEKTAVAALSPCSPFDAPQTR